MLCRMLACAARERAPCRLLLLLPCFMLMVPHDNVARAPLPAAAFEPDTRAKGSALLEQATWVQQTSNYGVRVRRLDAGERRAYLQRVAGAVVDPFASPENGAERFLTFLLELENRAADPLFLHIDACRLVTGSRGAIITPIGLEGLQAAYGLLGQDLPQAYLKAGPAILEGSRLLEPGQSISGLLVFSPVTPRTKSFRLELHFTLASGESVGMSAPYRRAPLARAGA